MTNISNKYYTIIPNDTFVTCNWVATQWQ